MASKTVFLIREARVEYLDLCAISNVSREEFFETSDLKRLICYGLVLEREDLVKVMWCDDDSDNTECEGIIIPRSCIVSIHYFGSADMLGPINGAAN